MKSAKNQFVLKFVALLVQRGIFKSATLFHLMVGHTHEDIDQLFALITALLKRKHDWQTPDEVLRHLAECALAKIAGLDARTLLHILIGKQSLRGCRWISFPKKYSRSKLLQVLDARTLLHILIGKQSLTGCQTVVSCDIIE